jgi:hypothetical protein
MPPALGGSGVSCVEAMRVVNLLVEGSLLTHISLPDGARDVAACHNCNHTTLLSFYFDEFFFFFW